MKKYLILALVALFSVVSLVPSVTLAKKGNNAHQSSHKKNENSSEKEAKKTVHTQEHDDENDNDNNTQSSSWVGTLTAINGSSTLTFILNDNGSSFTVDISDSDFFMRPETPASLSDLKVGDKLRILGSLNGNVIKASGVYNLTSHRAVPLEQVTVNILNSQYQPASIKVISGQTVVWKNNDSVPHTVTADDGSFNSGVISPGGTYTRTFSNDITRDYHCTLHPTMKGTVTVEQFSGSVPSQNQEVVGTLSVLNSSTTLTLAGNNGTTYSVNLSGAQLFKQPGNVTAVVSDFKLGDSLLVRGIVSGTTINATHVFDLTFHAPVTLALEDFIGSISAISGNNITLMANDGVTYNVSASGTEFLKGPLNTTPQMSDLLVGDLIVVRGTESSTSTVTANKIFDWSWLTRMTFRGTVSSVGTSSISFTGDNGVAYTANISSSTKIYNDFFGVHPILGSNIHVGDKILVVGSLSGSTITASSIGDFGTSTVPFVLFLF